MPTPRRLLAPALVAAAFTAVLAVSSGAQQPAHGLSAVLGGWRSVTDGGPAFRVDTAGWNGKTERASLVSSATRLFGVVNDTFVTNGLAPQAFPLAVHNDTKNFSEGTIRVQFKLVGGETDQNAGIAFDLKPNGEYLYLRYNTKDGNLALWRFRNGERSRLAEGEKKLQLKMGTWHELAVTLAGQHLTASLDEKALTFDANLTAPVAGRVGLWTKRDAITVFRNYRVTR